MQVFSKLFRKFFHNESGWVTPFSLLMMVVILMMGGLAIDYANGLRVKSQLRAAVDAAALAAVIDLPDTTAATAAGMAITNAYFPSERGRKSINPSDFIYGFVDDTTGIFVQGAAPTNAVRVLAGRDNSRGNPLATYLLGIVGIDELEIGASAIARLKSNAKCDNGGFFTNGMVVGQSTNSFFDGFCIYGASGVSIQQDNKFGVTGNNQGIEVGMNNLGTARPRVGQSQEGNVNWEKSLEERDYTLQWPGKINDIINAMETATSGSIPGFLPGNITSVLNVMEINGKKYKLANGTERTLVENTLYIVSKTADFGSGNTIKNIAVVAVEKIVLGGNTIANNVFLASRTDLDVASNSTIGPSNICSLGQYDSYLLSKTHVKIDSNQTMRGVLIASTLVISLQSTHPEMRGVHAEAGTGLTFQSGSSGSVTSNFYGCPNGLATVYGPGGLNEPGVPPNTYALIQ